MNLLLLTQDNTFIIGQVAWVLGKIMNGIFNLISMIGLPNIGLSIILFTIVINLLLLPLTIKQQKFSKLNNKMQPEIQAIQKKYKDKKDNDSMMAQNQEIQAVYAKYGVSPSGSCVQILIQMPILFALYRVIYAMPAYVTKVREAYVGVVEKGSVVASADSIVAKIMNNPDAIELIKGFKSSAAYSKKFASEAFLNGDVSVVQNTIIDCLNKASTADFQSVGTNFPELAGSVANTMEKLSTFNNFLGLNIGNSPQFIIGEAYKAGMWGLVIGAILIPVLSALTQLINIKLMPQPENQPQDDNGMASSMKAMNTVMPLMSAYFCFTLPSGMGLYWIASAVVRTIIMIVINKQIDKMDMDDLIKKNEVKSAKKLEKMKKQQEMMSNYASMNTKNISSKANLNKDNISDFREVKPSSDSTSKGGSTSGGSSMRDKVNMVRDYNNKNNK